jgi:hypothetical protein
MPFMVCLARSMRLWQFSWLLGAAVLLCWGCNSNPAANVNGEVVIESRPVPAIGHSVGLQSADGMPKFNIDKIQDIVGPYDHASTPIEVLRGGDLVLNGWAIDKASATLATAVDLAIDGTPYEAAYGSARPDVAQVLKVPGYLRSGFTFRFPGSRIASGSHRLTVRIVSADGKRYFEGPALTLVVN